MPNIDSKRYSYILSLSAQTEFTWELARFFVLFHLHIWPQYNLLTLTVLLCATARECAIFRMFIMRAIFKCRNSTFPEDSASMKLYPSRFQGGKGPLKWSNLLMV